MRFYNEGIMSDYDIAIILEDVNDKFTAILEGQQAMAHLPGAVAKLQDDMTEVKADVKVIKLAVKDQTKDHKTLVERVAKHWNKPPNDD